ncbi:DUF4931 domain-containing protein [Azotosporobacter soli]|uniref:DUF4931 domain-containing protein n=1 Tax=Azotosporobacter soli TaxID=3055040 RepID=UPI0031FEB4F7
MKDRKMTHLRFDYDIGRFKPVTVVERGFHCPFCGREQLENILAQEGSIVWLKNKFPVLEDTLQTVLIETEDCQSELSVYNKEHLHRVIRFGVEKWQELVRSGEYSSVLFFKNHGPYSGGTIRHPHMQIIGLKHLDYVPKIPQESFSGDVIVKEAGIELNLATLPKIGFIECNIRLRDPAKIDVMADYIQAVAHYLLHHFHKNCNSYNIFFYHLEEEIAVKLVPRFVTSPLFIGYSIPQISSRGAEVVREIQLLYFAEGGAALRAEGKSS